MSDPQFQTCATVVEVLIPGPQGPGGTGSSGIGGYAVSVENIDVGHVIAFDGEVWHNKPLDAGGDMLKAVYDTNNDGKVDTANLAEAVAWSGITNAPASFPPSAHVHEIADVTGLSTTLTELAPLASPALVGVPTAPTATVGTNTTQIATTAFVTSSIVANPGSAPVTWTTLPDKPLSFPPSLHTHVMSDIIGLDAMLAGKADVTALPHAASAAKLLAGSDNIDFVTAKTVADANGIVALNATPATVVMDLSQGLNFSLALPGNRTLANPSNARAGQTGSIWLTRSIAAATLSFDTHWKPSGNSFSISTEIADADLITFYVVTPNVIVFSVLNGFKP